MTFVFKGICWDPTQTRDKWPAFTINGVAVSNKDDFLEYDENGDNNTVLYYYKAFKKGLNQFNWTSSQWGESEYPAEQMIAGNLTIQNLNVEITVGYPVKVRYNSPNDTNQWVEGDLLSPAKLPSGQPYDVQMIVKGTPSELAAYTGYLEYVYDEEEVDEMIINGFASWRQYDDSHSVISGRATVRFATSGQIQCQTLKDADSLGTYINVG